MFLSSDFVAFEMATLAQCQLNLGLESPLADAINQGKDTHIMLAVEMAGGLSYEEGMRLKKAGDPFMGNMRTSAKPVNFGLGGLMGPPKLVFTARKQDVRFCELSGRAENCSEVPRVVKYGRRAIPPTCTECLSLAADYKEMWYRVWQMQSYHAVTIASSEQGYIDSFGTGMIRAEESPNACSNHLFQNLAAQIMKRACYLIAREAYTDRSSVLFNNYRTTVPIHDEVFGECRESVLHECMLRQTALMREACLQFCPDVKIETEPAACRRWFKGAKTVFGKDGRLKPWWPSKEKWVFEADQELMALDAAT